MILTLKKIIPVIILLNFFANANFLSKNHSNTIIEKSILKNQLINVNRKISSTQFQNQIKGSSRENEYPNSLKSESLLLNSYSKISQFLRIEASNSHRNKNFVNKYQKNIQVIGQTILQSGRLLQIVCSNGSVSYNTSNTLICMPCSAFKGGSGCKTCIISNTGVSCTSCLANYSEYSTSCCYYNQYFNQSQLSCKNCSLLFANCMVCNIQSCTKCAVGYYLMNESCNMSLNWTFSTVNGIKTDYCSVTFQNCYECNYRNCIVCFNNFNLSLGRCCLSNQTYSKVTLKCQAILNSSNSSSSNYTTSNNQSISSNSSSNLSSQNLTNKNNQNLSLNCLISQYANINNTCVNCSSTYNNCYSCTNKKCLQCVKPYILNQSSCYLCPDTQLYSPIQKRCVYCPSNCIICNQDYICDTCKDNFLLLFNQCRLIKENSQANVLSLLAISTAQVAISNPFINLINQNSVLRKTMNIACSMFALLDEMWLFSYHKKNYTYTIATLLDIIRQLQSSKFNPLSYFSKVDDIEQLIESNLNNYTKYGKIEYIGIQRQGSGFFPNIISFIFETIPQNLILFMLIKVLFNLIRRYKFSIFFRIYCFNCFYFILILDGNIQFFTYIASNQLQTFFHFQIYTKIQNALFIICAFLFLQGVLTIYFVIKYFYKKRSSYFMENVTNSIFGIFALFTNLSLRNIVFAAITSFTSENYIKMILLISLNELIFVILILYWIKKFSCYRQKIKISFILLFSFFRILLQFTFTIFNNKQDLEQIQQIVQTAIFLIYMWASISSIIFLFIKSSFKSYHQLFISSNISQRQQNFIQQIQKGKKTQGSIQKSKKKQKIKTQIITQISQFKNGYKQIQFSKSIKFATRFNRRPAKNVFNSILHIKKSSIQVKNDDTTNNKKYQKKQEQQTQQKPKQILKVNIKTIRNQRRIFNNRLNFQQIQQTKNNFNQLKAKLKPIYLKKR